MLIHPSDIDTLRLKVKDYMSMKRYNHTLGVERAAAKLGKYCLPEQIDKLRSAALLHDISKELPAEEQMRILASTDGIVESDFASPPAHHAFTAPFIVRRDFPNFADKDILSAVFNHTTGSCDMSIFDEIIFIADYIEDGREYAHCVKTRELLYERLNTSPDTEERIRWLHVAVVEILNFTIDYLSGKKMFINERTMAARNEFLKKISLP